MKYRLPLALLVALSLCIAAHAAEELKLPALFSNNMILQRDQPVPVWGGAAAGEEVAVSFGGQRKSAKADSNGQWMVKLDPMPACAEPRELVIECPARNLKNTFVNVLVGDVWLCSGQSNMGMAVKESLNGDQEIANAHFPEIRLFSVAQNPSLEEAKDVKGSWAECSPQSVGGFSGVGYFFGRELYRDLKIPIGLLLSSVGGTPAESWMPLDALKSSPVLAERADQDIARIKSQPEENKNFPIARAAWEQKYGVVPPPVSEAARGWESPALDTSDWKEVTLPATWARLGSQTGGVFWLRKEMIIPESAAGKTIRIAPNWVNEQYDTVYFNGVEIGRVKDQAPEFYNIQRAYSVPKELVKAGRNVVAVRIVSASPQNGMMVTPNPLGLPLDDPAYGNNQWLFKTESTFPALSPEVLKERPKPNTLAFRNVPTALYNGMISPLMPFAVKGAIWYQGESNAPRAAEYRDTLTLLINSWRKKWGAGDFPFLIQQLVNNDPPTTDPNQPGSWPIVREAQEQVAASLPNSGLSVGIELGSPRTIHPPNKQEVGKRLALVALDKVYGKDVVSSGPRYQSFQVEGPAIRVKLTHAEGLVSKGGAPKNFAIAGEDKKFVWADAKLEGDSIILSSPQVPQPTSVRYAWATNPDGCNVFNAAGLPLAPFRTDDWK